MTNAHPQRSDANPECLQSLADRRKNGWLVRSARSWKGARSCVKSLENAVRGRHYRLSPAVLLRAMRASGLGLDDRLGAPATAGRCRACGTLRRAP